jgi:signal transduction histidine kinase
VSVFGSLRARMILIYAGLISIGFAILAVIAGGQISQSALHDDEEKLENQSMLVANGLSDPAARLAEGQLAAPDFARIVQTYASTTGTRLTIISPDGRAVLDSAGALPADFSPDQPEVQSALAGRVSIDTRSDPSGALTFYAAAPLHSDEGPLGAVRLALPAAGTQTTIARRRAELALGILLITVAALTASLLLARSLTRPLDALRQSAMRLAGGDLAHRIDSPGADEIGQLGGAFNHLAAQVQRMIDEQGAFASNASHELRAPLSAIRVRSEALRAGKLDKATARQYVAEIDDEAARLGRLVEDLMLLYRLDTGRTGPGDELIDPARFARETARDLAGVCGARELALTLDAPDDLPPVQASLGYLRVVFRNLLDNAIKYTPDGGTITWRMRAEDNRLVSTITDTGQGISAEDLPHVFERFFRADKAHTRAVPGVGLGLPLIDSVVRYYGGQITLVSAGIGLGTTAQVIWPLANGRGQRSDPGDGHNENLN